MEITYELYIPPKFFDSAGKENDTESISERIAKAILVNLFGISDAEVTRGNPLKNEPDYLINGKGYEVTFGISQDVIKKIKGLQAINSDEEPVEQALINAINSSLERKTGKSGTKRYTVDTVPVIFCIQPFPLWYRNIPKIEPTSFEAIEDANFSDYWNNRQTSRNAFFKKLYDKYVATGIFSDIFILQLTHDENYLLYSIRDFNLHREKGYMKLFGTKNKLAFPSCKVVSTQIGNVGDPIHCNYIIKKGVLEAGDNETTI